jgi:hypothetical protein
MQVKSINQIDTDAKERANHERFSAQHKPHYERERREEREVGREVGREIGREG